MSAPGVKAVDPPPMKPAPVPSPVKAGEEMTNSIGMKLVSIPAGKFLMGSPSDDKERGAGEFQHEVEITKGFWLGKYEVSQEEYEKVMGTNPSNSKGPKLPVENVSWDDAMEFCRKLSEKEGQAYRLPTEAEWEYACRAGTTSRYSTGDVLTKAQANYHGTGTMAVGSYAANAFGLHDMHGNVAEWCSDWDGWYPPHMVVNPTGPEIGIGRMLRGGSFQNQVLNVRSAFRHSGQPSSRGTGHGFRVARSLTP